MKLNEVYEHPKDSVGTRVYSKNHRKGTVTGFWVAKDLPEMPKDHWWNNDDWNLRIHWDGDAAPYTHEYVCWARDIEVVVDETVDYTYPKEE